MERRRLTEYALIVTLTIFVTVTVLSLLGTQLSDVLAWIAGEIH